MMHQAERAKSGVAMSSQVNVTGACVPPIKNDSPQ